jgi:peptidase E
MVRDADVVYFTGGYSDKLQTCLFGDKQSGSSPLLEEIQKKKMVAGSSAGAMVRDFF